MSLINDALKKAQKQRTEEVPLSTLPNIGGESATQISSRSKPAAVSSMIIRIAIGGVCVFVLLIGGFFIVRWMFSDHATPAPAKPAAVVAQVAPTPTTPAPVVATPPTIVTQQPIAPVVSQPVVSAAVPVAVTPAPVAKPVVELPPTVAPAPVTVAENKPVVAVPVAEPEPEEPRGLPNIKFMPRAVEFVDTLRVAGIRVSPTDSKVLMNDRVYRIGDIVEHNLGIRLVGIASTALTFEDERGARHTRNF